ncbi:MAG: Rrf2 family transcriptional regulator [Planctomycetes bacterium]|nr:Rrf2 family transcriptional regulator [Planctomycetota bacterium]
MISKRARYALHGVGYLAQRYEESPISFAEILEYLKEYSGELGFSHGYIAKIFQELSRAGITIAIVGRKGGYTLSRPPRELRIIDVVGAMDGHPIKECCLLSVGGGCKNQQRCGVSAVIRGAQKSFYDFLAAETAETLCRRMFGKRASPSTRSRGKRAAASRRKKARPARSRA